MSKKRNKRFQKQRTRSRKKEQRYSVSRVSTRLGNNIVSFLYNKEEPVPVKIIYKHFLSSTNTKKSIDESIIALTQTKTVHKSGKSRLGLHNSALLFEGVVTIHPKGFGFVEHLTSKYSQATYTKDPFLSPSKIGSTRHGDRVLIHITGVGRNGRPEATIISLLKRGSETIIGYFVSGPPAKVQPEDPHFPYSVGLPQDQQNFAAHGEVVIVELAPDSGSGLLGRITEVLGAPESIDVQMRLVIEKHNLPHVFSKKIMEEVEIFNENIEVSDDRLNLLHIDHITIDGESAKDFDDAIAVVKTTKGYRLYVSIADVSHYVAKDSALDREAYQRGTSIYFPGRVIPMLPEKLSNNLCSLVPNKNRYTFSVIIDFDDSGKVQKKKFAKSIICSRHRFTYTTIKKILIDQDIQARTSHKAHLTSLTWAEKLATVLHKRRMERGAIGFNIPEPEIRLKEDGNIDTITRAERNFAHQLIEEFMLAANEAVASFFTEKQTETLYRIHEKPDLEKVQEFKKYAETLDIHLPDYSEDPSWFGMIIKRIQGSSKEYVVNNLLLRTMQQAKYDTVNGGHFGLAATDYTHFTSPIRRYPDLIVHRRLEALLSSNLKESSSLSCAPLQSDGTFLSQRERVAITAERDMTSRLQLFFMEDYIGHTFDAIISGVTDFAIFIELTQFFINGSVDIDRIGNEYYLYDAKNHRLLGEISGRILSLGQKIEVVLLEVDHKRQRINFSISDDE